MRQTHLTYELINGYYFFKFSVFQVFLYFHQYRLSKYSRICFLQMAKGHIKMLNITCDQKDVNIKIKI